VQRSPDIAEYPPVVIPVFVSNLGCPYRCVFCDQTQYSNPVPPEDVQRYAADFIGRCRNPEKRSRILAFYGGSFTGIEEGLFDEYLDAARNMMKTGLITGIKASTRPDMIDTGILSRLKDAGFVEMEIGAQSMDDEVLKASGRGHGSDDVRNAARLVRDSGLKLGIQIMAGLPGEDRPSFVSSVNDVCALKPDTARIYPAVVVKGTGLETMYESGDYRPLSLDEALARTLYAYIRLKESGAEILRMGVPVEGLNVAAGPFHPAFGFLVRSYAFGLMLDRAVNALDAKHVGVNPRDVPALIGYERENMKRFGFSYEVNDNFPRECITTFMQENSCIGFKDIINHII
jgi:histone acetyltransferase (RNA polymerase elongator complex component)